MTKYSVAYWYELCRDRLTAQPDFAEMVGNDWLEAQFADLREATAQLDCHVLLRLLCAAEEAAFAEAARRLTELRGQAGFVERLERLKGASGDEGLNRWNELVSASLVVQSGLQVSFPGEVGHDLPPASDFYVDGEDGRVAFEVTTVNETPERVSALNEYVELVKTAANRARREGKPGVYGGTVPQPARFTRVVGIDPDGRDRRRESVGGAIRSLNRKKPGSVQAADAAWRVLHIFLVQGFFRRHDFLPLHSQTHGRFTYEYSGRIFAAFFGRVGDTLLWHHIQGSDVVEGIHAESQRQNGRFVRRTSLSGCVLTLPRQRLPGVPSEGNNDLHVLYVPAQQYGAAIPVSLVQKLFSGARFDTHLSVVPEHPELQGPG